MGAKTSVGALGLWSGLATGPMAWSTTLLVNYVLTEQACSPSLARALPGISGAMLALVCVAGVWSWRTLRRRRAAIPADATGAAERHDFMGHMALLSCALFAIAIVAQMVPPWILHDCR